MLKLISVIRKLKFAIMSPSVVVVSAIRTRIHLPGGEVQPIPYRRLFVVIEDKLDDESSTTPTRVEFGELDRSHDSGGRPFVRPLQMLST